MKKQALFHENGRHSLKRCLLILLSVCMIIQTVPIVSVADQKPGIRLRAAVEEGLEIIHSLPNLAEKNNVIGYDYYDTLPWYWEGLQRTFDLFGIRITDALTNMNRSQYYFTMALTMCSKAEPIDWTNSEALQRALGVNGNSYNIDEIIETFQLIYDEDSPLFTSDVLQYAKALKEANYSIKGINAFCDIVNEFSLFLSLDWDQVGYLIEAWQENGNNELKEIASVLKNMKDVFSGSVESTLLIMQILAKHGLDIIIDGMIDTTLNAVADGALFFYKAALFGVDLVTRFSVLTGSFNDMKFAAEALEACNKKYTKANKFFFLDDEYYIETEEARDRLKKDFTWLAYLGINYAEACAIMDDAYVNYIELGKNSMAGNLYIDKTMIDRADRARDHANKFREQADQIRDQLKLVNLLIDNGGMMPEDVDLYEDYKKDWAHHWVMRDYPENYLDITFEWDYTMKVVAHFEGMPDNEYELKIYEDMTGTGFFGDPFKGLVGSLWVNDPLEGCMTAELGYIGNIDSSSPLFPYIVYYDGDTRYGSEQYYVIADDADDSGYYWDGWEEPIYLGPEGVEELFAYMNDRVLLAASGAGAWEGRLKFDEDGGFIGYYYDEDAGDETIYEVYFTGKVDTTSIQLDGTNGYLMKVQEVSAQHTPGTEAVTDFGSRIVYEEPLFKKGETLLLTRPGTTDPEIPEMVQAEIGGVFGQWEDFETFITLSRLADGWGFFADETSPFTWDVEPFKTIREVDSSLPVFGIDQDYTGWDANDLFNYLSKQKMFSMDSNGGPSSEMRINPDGSFNGIYQGYDSNGFCISDFAGSFSPTIEWYGKTTGYLTINAFSVQNDPNMTGTTTWGEKFTYSDRPFRAGEKLFFTLPGTKFTDDIPDDIRSKIYWCYDPFDNYLECITLNKLDWDMSWWLYADTDYPDTSDIEPIPVARPEIGSTLPSFGDDSGFTPEPDQEKTFWKEGKGIDYKWGPGLFKERSQIYNNELALAAGVLSWAIEDERTVEISNLFKELGITNGKYCCYKYDRDKKNALRYKLWESKDDDAAFAIGQKVISLNGKDDITLLIVIGRGTQPGHKREELGADWLRKGDGPEEVAGQRVLRSISSFEEAMWQAFGDYVDTNPIETSKVKILVTGHSLGGAMANCFGARITKDINQITGLKNKATQDDIYVYTFGAIKVLTEDKNASEGFENIHNVYNYHDTFGPNGGMHGLDVSSPKMKFGHTELYYLKDETEGFLETKNHEMPNYLTAIKDKLVNCDSSGSFKSQVFSLLSKQKLLASDSRGEWTGEMIIGADGSFTGFYYDYDITGITASSFTGCFSTDVKWQGNTSCYLTIKDFTVKNEPYTTGTTQQGIEFMYIDGPFHVGEQLFLTLPGTPDEDIPFTVSCEIGWLYGRYKNYGHYLTLSTVEEPAGWGYFADETNPETRDMPSITIPGFEEPIPEIGSSLPTFGDNPRTSGDYKYQILSDKTAKITLYTGNDTEVHIPASLDGHPISQIGTRAFYNNENLDSVWLDQAPVTVIQYEAFRGCENLRFVQLPKTLKEIQDMAFDYCIGLTEIVFSEQMQIVGQRAFSYCRKLGEVYCPDSLLYIDGTAFDHCEKNTIWFHVNPDSRAEHYCALNGYN